MVKGDITRGAHGETGNMVIIDNMVMVDNIAMTVLKDITVIIAAGILTDLPMASGQIDNHYYII
jgi:hypothetical protein